MQSLNDIRKETAVTDTINIVPIDIRHMEFYNICHDLHTDILSVAKSARSVDYPSEDLSELKEGIAQVFSGDRSRLGFIRGITGLLSGEKGSGKSRLCMSLGFAAVMAGQKVLYVTGEMESRQLSSLPIIRNLSMLSNRFGDNFQIESSTDPDKHVQLLNENNIDLVIIDSLNTIDDMRPSTIKDIIKSKYKRAAEENQCYILFLNQANQDGTAKGGTSPGHYVDQEFVLHSHEIHKKYQQFSYVGSDIPTEGYIRLESIKNRYGINTDIIFRHSDVMEYWGTSKFFSDFLEKIHNADCEIFDKELMDFGRETIRKSMGAPDPGTFKSFLGHIKKEFHLR